MKSNPTDNADMPISSRLRASTKLKKSAWERVDHPHLGKTWMKTLPAFGKVRYQGIPISPEEISHDSPKLKPKSKSSQIFLMLLAFIKAIVD